jgi:hypothetical protein
VLGVVLGVVLVRCSREDLQTLMLRRRSVKMF